MNAPYDRKSRDGELFLETTLREHQDVIDKQYYAPLNIIQEVIPHMQKGNTHTHLCVFFFEVSKNHEN